MKMLFNRTGQEKTRECAVLGRQLIVLQENGQKCVTVTTSLLLLGYTYSVTVTSVDVNFLTISCEYCGCQFFTISCKITALSITLSQYLSVFIALSAPKMRTLFKCFVLSRL